MLGNFAHTQLVRYCLLAYKLLCCGPPGTGMRRTLGACRGFAVLGGARRNGCCWGAVGMGHMGMPF